MKRKAQFFTIGLIMLALMIITVAGLQGQAFITGDPDPNLRDFFHNGLEEFPHVIDKSLTDEFESTSLEQDLESYMDFVYERNHDKGINPDYYFFVGVEREEDVFDVIVGNYWETGEINITVDGDVEEQLVIDEGDTEVVEDLSMDETVSTIGLQVEEDRSFINFDQRSFYLITGIKERFDETWRSTVSSDNW